MNAATRTHDQLLPQPPGGLLPGAALAVLAHAAMLAALTLAVQWRTSAPESVAAELWSAVPQVAAPPAPPPAPPPEPAPAPPAPAPAPAPAPPPRQAEPEAQIAIEQAKKRQAEQERQERLREERAKAQREKERELERERAEREKAERMAKAKAEQERREREAEARKREQAQREKEQKEREKAEERRLAELRQKQLERMMGQVGGSSSTSGGSPGGTAAVTSGPSASYAGKLVAAIKPNVVFTDSVSGNPAAEVEVRAGASGSILSRRLVRSSGHKEWDEAVLRAIDRTGTLPRDVDGRVPPVILLAFRPNELN